MLGIRRFFRHVHAQAQGKLTIMYVAIDGRVLKKRGEPKHIPYVLITNINKY